LKSINIFGTPIVSFDDILFLARDYLKHSEKLRKDYDDVLRGTLTSVAEPAQTAGRIYVVGQGDMGQLGLGEDLTEALKPMLLMISGGLRVLQVACGGMHSLCITEDGGVFRYLPLSDSMPSWR
jgi:hypothetical protein